MLIVWNCVSDDILSYQLVLYNQFGFIFYSSINFTIAPMSLGMSRVIVANIDIFLFVTKEKDIKCKCILSKKKVSTQFVFP